MGEAMPSSRPGTARYRVLSLEPDDRLRTRMTLEMAGIAAAPSSSFDDTMREIVPGEATVVLFGASLANDAGFEHVQRLGRSFPDVGVVLLAEELTLPLLQQALRVGVRGRDHDRRRRIADSCGNRAGR